MGYSPDEARDDKGKWTSGGGGGGGARAGLPSKKGGAVGKWASSRSRAKSMPPASAAQQSLAFKLPGGGSLSASVMQKLSGTVKAGKLAPGISPIAHAAMTHAVLGQHGAGIKSLMDRLKQAAPEGAQVSGRVKEVESATEKLSKGASWFPHIAAMTDLTGGRIVVKDNAEVRAVEQKIRAAFPEVKEHLDYIAHPKQDTGYRSSHMIVRDHDGLTKEIQIRTQNQDKHAIFMHDAVYKPHTQEQRQLMQTHGEHVQAYVKAMGDYFAKRDEGQDPGPKPVPHPEVKRVLGEL